jgi:hypothetical protein
LPLPATGLLTGARGGGALAGSNKDEAAGNLTIGPEKASDPAFLEHLETQMGGRKPITPDAEDLDEAARADTIEEQANQYRLAQARKMLRMYSEWKAAQN